MLELSLLSLVLGVLGRRQSLTHALLPTHLLTHAPAQLLLAVELQPVLAEDLELPLRVH